MQILASVVEFKGTVVIKLVTVYKLRIFNGLKYQVIMQKNAFFTKMKTVFVQ